MATIDVTQNGVTFNEKSAAAANGDALERIFHDVTQNGDIIDFPFTPGDQLWVEGNNPNQDGERCIDLDVSEGLAQNLTVRGRTDSNDEPAGEIIGTADHNGWYYLVELSVRGGLTIDFEHLRFNQNAFDSGQGGSTFLVRDQTAGASNDITFHNCHFLNGNNINAYALEVNGVHWEYCTFGATVSYQPVAIKQDKIDNVDPRCTIKNCLSEDGAAVGINHSPGKVLIKDTVVRNCGYGIKSGTDGSGRNHDAEWIRVRIENISNFGHHAISESPLTATTTMEDVIIDTTGDYGIYTQDAYNIEVRDGSSLVIANTGNDGAFIRDEVQLKAPNATIEAIQNANYGIEHISAEPSTIDTLRTGGNERGSIRNTGNLNISTHDDTVSTPSDILTVPTASEVGIGTSGDTPEQPKQTHFDDEPYELPAEIDATHFDRGGEDVAYNQVNTNREDYYGFRESETTVGIQDPGRGGTGDGSIGFVSSGEWMEWTVKASPGEYGMTAYIASQETGTIRVLVDGNEVGTVQTTTNGTYNYQPSWVGRFTIGADGTHVIRVEWEENWLNLDRLAVTDTSVGGYTLPQEGQTDWHIPLNQNFAAIQGDIASVATRHGVDVEVDLSTPEKGMTDWHRPLNQNFAAIEQAVQTLAASANVSSVGGYAQPARGTEDWHVPLNQNFEAIETDLEAIDAALP